MDAYRIILADDHVIFRQGMKRLIDEVPELSVVGEASDGLKLLSLLEDVAADMVLLDIAMPGMRGIEATREITQRFSHVKVLMLTMHKNKEYLYHAIASGASGYLLKEDSDLELITAIETIQKGDLFISSLFADELGEDFSNISREKIQTAIDPLSVREREILKLISEGLANKEIASEINISVRTVEAHRANIMRKLKLSNTAELVRYALQTGIADVAV